MTTTRPVAAAPQTLTFMFSDLRDYTRFVEQFGDAAATTLIADYRRIVRTEIAKHVGAGIKTEGDSFYVVFTSAGAAVSAATAILREADRTGTHWGFGRELTEAYIRAAREGTLLSAVEQGRHRATTAEELSDRSGYLTIVGAYFLAGDLTGTLAAAEPALDTLRIGAFAHPHIAAIVAMAAADALGDAASRDRWIAAAEERYLSAGHEFETARVAYAHAMRARIAGDHETAARGFRDASDRSHALWGMEIVATLADLEHAALVVGHDRDAARRDVERARAFWRRAKATHFLATIDRKAQELGIATSE